MAVLTFLSFRACPINLPLEYNYALRIPYHQRNVKNNQSLSTTTAPPAFGFLQRTSNKLQAKQATSENIWFCVHAFRRPLSLWFFTMYCTCGPNPTPTPQERLRFQDPGTPGGYIIQGGSYTSKNIKWNQNSPKNSRIVLCPCVARTNKDNKCLTTRCRISREDRVVTHSAWSRFRRRSRLPRGRHMN